MKASVHTPIQGEAPRFFEEQALDRLHAMVLTLAEQLCVQREYSANLEKLLIDKGVLEAGQLQTITLSNEEQAQRLAQHQTLMAELLAPLRQEMEIT